MQHHDKAAIYIAWWWLSWIIRHLLRVLTFDLIMFWLQADFCPNQLHALLFLWARFGVVEVSSIHRLPRSTY